MVLDETTGDASINIKPLRMGELAIVGEVQAGGATLISIDGSRIYSMRRSGPEEVLKDFTQTDGVPRIVPGTYYVVPGLFIAGRYQMAVLEAARSRLDVGNAKIPQLVAASGQNAEMQVDMVAAVAAILAIPHPR